MIHGFLKPEYIFVYDDGIIVLDAFRSVVTNNIYSRQSTCHYQKPFMKEEDYGSICTIIMKMCFGRNQFKGHPSIETIKKKFTEKKKYSTDIIKIIVDYYENGRLDILTAAEEKRFKRKFHFIPNHCNLSKCKRLNLLGNQSIIM